LLRKQRKTLVGYFILPHPVLSFYTAEGSKPGVYIEASSSNINCL